MKHDDLLQFGILNIDKPSGPTSFQVSQYLKQKLATNKTSHFGTLDPMVSGVLPIGIGRACRLSDWFMHKDKTYVGIMRLHKEVPDTQLQEVITHFIGTINQLPPVRSRVKRALRERTIKSFTIKEQVGTDVLFETTVQAGTYIRKLIHDMGLQLGGAHMLELRRTQASLFKEPAHTLYEFENAVEAYNKGDKQALQSMILSPHNIIKEVLPIIQAPAQIITQLLKGKPLMKHDFPKGIPNESFALFSEKKLLGIYHPVSEGTIIARPDFVYN